MDRSNEHLKDMTSFIGREILQELCVSEWNYTVQKGINNNAISLATSVGTKRARNEDRCAVAHITSLNGNKYSLAIACDGVGGSESGDQAANIAIATVIEEVLLCSSILPLRQLVDSAVRAADTKVKSTLNGLGMTTISLILSSASERDLIGANVGDSRIYSWSGETQQLNQISVDDTFENELKNRRILDDSILDAKGLRGRLFQAIGEASRTSADLFVRLYGKEYFEKSGAILATDGAWKIDEVGFNELAKNSKTTHDVVRRVLTFSNWIGGVDNVSAIAIGNIEDFISGVFHASINTTDIGSVTVWLPDSKVTVKENFLQSDKGKSISQGIGQANKRKTNYAKETLTKVEQKKPRNQGKSKHKNPPLNTDPQLELVSLSTKEISKDDDTNSSSNEENHKQASNKLRVEISTDKNS